jgi:undecaprenyl-diphosphatase
VNAFDASILGSLNQYAHRWWPLDTASALVTDGRLLRGTVVMGGLWFLWFASRDRPWVVVPGAIGTIVAVAVSRGLAMGVPYRPRPIVNPELALIPPFGARDHVLDRLTAFPSDTATLFFAIAMVYMLISHRWGVAAFTYVTLVVAIPRIYLLVHSPTDIIGGAVIGITCVLAAKRWTPPAVIGRARELETRHPGLFYAVAFLTSFETADIFEDLRKLGHFALEAMHIIGHV